jgi:hypothetical protein
MLRQKKGRMSTSIHPKYHFSPAVPSNEIEERIQQIQTMEKVKGIWLFDFALFGYTIYSMSWEANLVMLSTFYLTHEIHTAAKNYQELLRTRLDFSVAESFTFGDTPLFNFFAKRFT